MLAYGSRKNRNNRKNRKISRRNRMYGGAAYTAMPMSVSESLAGSSPSQMNLKQGEQYGAFHANQHGGMAAYPMSVVDSLLPSDMAASARVTPLNTYINDVKGLRDPGQEAQMGGRRRRTRNSRGRFTKKRAGKKARKGTKRSGRKGTKRNGRKRNASGRFLKMRGGAVQPALSDAASANAPGMLLDAGAEARAVRGMNPEWSLAPNPNSFAPRV
jgi:hypothetical protein